MDNDTDTGLDRDMDMESARDMDMVSDRVVDRDMEMVNELLTISNVTQKIRETTVSKLLV